MKKIEIRRKCQKKKKLKLQSTKYEFELSALHEVSFNPTF